MDVSEGDQGTHPQTKFGVDESRRMMNRLVKRWNDSLGKQINHFPGGEFFLFMRCVAKRKQEEFIHTRWLGTDELSQRCIHILKREGVIELPKESYDPRIEATDDLLNPEVPKTFIERSKKARDLVRWAWNLVRTENKSKHMYSLVASGKESPPGWWTKEFGDAPFTSHEVGQRCVQVIEILTDDRRAWMEWEPVPGIEPEASGFPELQDPALNSNSEEPGQQEPNLLREPLVPPPETASKRKRAGRPNGSKAKKKRAPKKSQESKARAARTSKRVKRPSVLQGFDISGECKKMRQFK